MFVKSTDLLQAFEIGPYLSHKSTVDNIYFEKVLFQFKIVLPTLYLADFHFHINFNGSITSVLEVHHLKRIVTVPPMADSSVQLFQHTNNTSQVTASIY